MSTAKDPEVVKLYKEYASVAPGSDVEVAAKELEARAKALEDSKTLAGRYQAGVAHALAARLRNGQLQEPGPKGYGTSSSDA